MLAGQALGQAKTVYAAALQGAGKALTAAHVIGDTPPPINQTARHWAYSLFRVHDSLAIAELDVPWWTYRAIDAVELWLATHEGPVRVIEYGSGASTFWLSKRCAEVHSVEHHRGFGEMMAAELAGKANVSLRIIEPTTGRSPRMGSQKEGHDGLDFDDYVHSIDDVDGEFDLVVIDGRAREACLEASRGRLARGGIIVYDNSLRRRYRVAIGDSGLVEHRYRGLTPTLPYPDQTSLLRVP
ncbi:MAG: class I SAM-dependent methyltransferase [Actinomycetota bacterium]|nr:class I SAM-dependent methyltransferase [Actinomycetota bacterium]